MIIYIILNQFTSANVEIYKQEKNYKKKWEEIKSLNGQIRLYEKAMDRGVNSFYQNFQTMLSANIKISFYCIKFAARVKSFTNKYNLLPALNGKMYF